MYDIIIIGGGAAGLSAAIYAMRGGMKTLVVRRQRHMRLITIPVLPMLRQVRSLCRSF